jgi:hypothetical protein
MASRKMEARGRARYVRENILNLLRGRGGGENVDCGQ